MIKILVPAIAKEVGTTAALLLQHINYWMFTQEVDKVFRTNNELVKDLNDMFTVFQIQYAKKKLVDNGYLVLTFEKGCNRTTHYTFTEKAVSLLKEHNDYLKDKTHRKIVLAVPTRPVPIKDAMVVPEEQNVAVNEAEELEMKAPKPPVQQTSRGMKKCFEEYGKINNKVVREIPDALKGLVKGRTTNARKEIDLTSPEDGDILNIFSRVPNVEVLEQNRAMKEQMLNFKEDY